MKHQITSAMGAAMLSLACAAVYGQVGTPDTRPLLDERGEVEHPDARAIPANPEHRTHAGLYATTAQARLLESTMHDQVIAQRVDCCGEQGVDEAVRRVWHTHVAYETPTTVPVLIYGDDMQHGALVVDRLTDRGLSRVFLVSTP